MTLEEQVMYDDIIQTLQKKVDEIASVRYKSDKCPPEFTVSLMFDYSIEEGKMYARVTGHKILLTITHLGSTFSEVLFPRLDYRYGYEPLADIMKYLYNRTM